MDSRAIMNPDGTRNAVMICGILSHIYWNGRGHPAQYASYDHSYAQIRVGSETLFFRSQGGRWRPASANEVAAAAPPM